MSREFDDIFGSLDSTLIDTRSQRERELEKEREHEIRSTSWFDQSPVHDFAGNTLWGIMEAAHVPTLIDAANDNKMSRFLGHNEWEDESWAGTVGYGLGTGIGFLSALKWWGKGLNLASQGIGKLGAKHYKDDIAKGLVDIGGKAAKDPKLYSRKLFNQGSKAIDDAVKVGKKATTPLINWSQRSVLRHNPLGSPLVQGATAKSLKNSIIKDLALSPKKADEVVKLVMTGLQKYKGPNFHSFLTKAMLNRGWSERAATRIGGMLYEGALLSSWDVFAGEVTDIGAKYAYGLDENEWGYKSWYSRAIHGALTGGILANARTIPGGRETVLWKSGVLADVKNMGRALKHRFKNVENMDPRAKQAALKTMLESSGNNTKIFKDVPGLGNTILTKDYLTTKDSEILTQGMKYFQRQLPRLLKDLTVESVKDISGSMPRMFIGGIGMNAVTWAEMWHNGQMGDYSPEQAVWDTFVGAMYMKRGTKLPGSSEYRFPKFYKERGIDPQGHEISRMLDFMDIMGYKESELKLHQVYRLMNPINALESQVLKNQISGNTDLKIINDTVKEHLTEAGEAAKIIDPNSTSYNPDAKNWRLHLRDHADNLLKKADKATNPDKKQKLMEEYKSAVEMFQVAEVVEGSVLLGHSGKTSKPMTGPESIEYVKKLANIKLNKGAKSLNTDNVQELITRLRDASVNDVTGAVKDAGVEYIMQSLEALGLVSELQFDPRTGRIHIHESILEALEINKGKEIKGEFPYHDTFYSLSETIRQAQAAGVVQVSDKGMKFSTQEAPPSEVLKNVDRLYKQHTEQMHDLIFNEQGSSSWRDIIPGWKDTQDFYDSAIMGSVPVWHAVQTQNRVARMKFAYDVLTGNRETSHAVADQFTKIRDWFNGKNKVKIKVDDAENLTIELQEFMDRINQVRGILNPNRVDGAPHEISIGELKSMREKVSDPVEGLGNILIDPTEFHHFSQYVYKRYVDEITGNPNITHGLKKVIINALDKENPLSVRSGGRVDLITSRTLRDLFLDGKKINVGEEKDVMDQNISNLIDIYEKRIENTLRFNLNKSGSQVGFSDNIRPDIDIISKRDVAQRLREMIGELDVMAKYEIESYTNKLGELGLRIDELLQEFSAQELVSKDNTIDKKLAEAVGELSSEAGNLQAQLQILLNNRDAVGLKILIDSRLEVAGIVDRFKADPLKDSKSIIKYKEELRNYLVKSLTKRNETLRIDTILEANDYVQGQLDDMAMTDRKGKVNIRSNTVSDNQYLTRWFPKQNSDFLETIKTNPISLLNKIDKLSNVSKDMLKKYEENPDILNFESESFVGVKSYMDNILAPIINSQKSRVSRLRSDKLGTTADQKWRNFVSDTYQVIVSGLASKKMPVAIFENGVLSISEGTISNWGVGLNKLESSLGLTNLYGSMVLAGQRVGTKYGYTTRMDAEILSQIKAKASAGTLLDISSKEILTSEESAFIDRLAVQITGTGRGGSVKYLPIVLDQNTTIYLHQGANDVVRRIWSDPASQIRKDLYTIFDGVTGHKDVVDRYLEGVLGGKTDKNTGYLDLPKNANTIKELVMLTRLINGPADFVKKIIESSTNPSDGMSELKYLRLDNPRTGVSLNERTLQFSKMYLEKMYNKNDILMDGVDIFNNHFFKNGKLTKHRKLVINDEGGADGTGKGKYFFDTNVRARAEIEAQVKEQYNMDSNAAKEKAAKLLEEYKPAAASAANGMTYLSLPEMTSMLMAKGASPEWFIRDRAGKIIGFNVAIKPIEYHSEINSETGAINIFAGKTAYTYDPVMDARMKNSAGEYILDSITFQSAAKKNAHKEGGKPEFVDRSLELREGIELKKDFKQDLADNILDTDINPTTIVEIPRSAIFIKSIQGIHDATMSFGFLNFTSNNSLRQLNRQTKSIGNVKDMMDRYSFMLENPWSYRGIAEQMTSFGLESGDMAARLMGIEGIINAGGLPVFEYMTPQIERLMTSEYLSTRNFTSSQIKDGNYNVMVMGDGLSQPVKSVIGPEGFPTLESFGGSGIPYAQWSKNITHLLRHKGRGDGLSFVFTVNKALLDKFPELKGALDVGNDIEVTHDGRTLGKHNHIFSTKGIERKILEKFESYMKEKYAAITKDALDTGMNTLGDLILFLDGKPFQTSDVDYKIDNKSKNAYVNKIKEGKENLFQGIFVGNTDLRTPKAGLNDWVTTKIEKLLDRRKGPVSEMNMLDVIDPQQADFDIDKSSSFHSLPGVTKHEIFNTSGIIDPATNVFDIALKEVLAENPAYVEDYKMQMILHERSRPLLVRQHSVASFLNQYFTNREKGGDLWSASPNVDLNHSLVSSYVDGNQWRIQFKGGNDLKDAIGFTKKLIYSAIDSYKEPDASPEFRLHDLVWTDSQLGLLRIQKQNKRGEWIDFQSNEVNELPTQIKKYQRDLIKNVLNPLGSLFDLAKMSESNMDGTSRKLSLFDMVNRFQTVKNSIRWAGLNYNGYKEGKYQQSTPNELFNLTDNILNFLGERYVDPSSNGGMSQHPLIRGLMTMEKGLTKHFKAMPDPDTSIGSFLAGQAGTSSRAISDALKNIIKDQSKWVELDIITHERNQLEDSMSIMRARGQRGTSRYKALESQLKFKTDIINQFNQMINSPQYREADVFSLKPGRTYKIGDDWGNVGVYDKNGNFKYLAAPGSSVKVNKGDRFVKNFKSYRLGNININTQRRAMSKAFNVNLYGLDAGEIATVDGIFREFKAKLRNAGGIISKTGPMTSDRFGLLSEAQLQVVTDHLKLAMASSHPMKAELLGKQFFYRMLGPKPIIDTFDVVGYDKARGENILNPSYERNSFHERLVFTMLDRLRNGQGKQIVGEDIAKEWYQDIIDRHKNAFIQEWDPTLTGDMFNFAGSKRGRGDFDIMSMPDVLPRFVKEGNLNSKAKDVLMSYLRGTYFLDPIELYRLTAGLGNTSMGKMPAPSTIGSRIRNAWQGSEGYRVDPRGDWYLAKKPYRNSLHEHVDRATGQDAYSTEKTRLENKKKGPGC